MTSSIHTYALSRGGVSGAEMPRGPFKLKGEGSERPAVGLVRKKKKPKKPKTCERER